MYVDLHVIEEALEKEYDRLSVPILEGKAKDTYERKIGELMGIRSAAGIIKDLFMKARQNG